MQFKKSRATYWLPGFFFLRSLLPIDRNTNEWYSAGVENYSCFMVYLRKYEKCASFDFSQGLSPLKQL